MSEPAEKGGNYGVALYSLMLLFFMMGFITCLNDILIPYLKAIFNLNYTQANFINLCFFGAYFVMSIPSGFIIHKIGYKGGMIMGFVVAALGCLLFYPAAGLRVYGLFLAALFVLASGITLLQVAGNPYVAALGKPETSSARLTLTQAFNSVGTTIAPYFGSLLILSNLPKVITDANTIDVKAVQTPYLFIGGALVLIAVILFMLKLPSIGHNNAEQADTISETKTSAWAYKHLVLGAIGIFCYVGAEVAIGSHIVNYLQSADLMNLSANEAGQYVSYYWGGAMVGRFIGSLTLNRDQYSGTRFNVSVVLISVIGFGAIYGLKCLLSGTAFSLTELFTIISVFAVFSIFTAIVNSVILRLRKPGDILAFHGVVSAILVIASIFSTGTVAMWTILLVGLMNSLMFATIFTLAIDGLGRHTDSGAGILSTAIVGGAIVPFLYGMIGDVAGLKIAFFLPVLCYAYIIYYGVKGHKKAE